MQPLVLEPQFRTSEPHLAVATVADQQPHHPHTRDNNHLTLLLADTNSPTSPTCSLRVLTSDSQTPVVSQTSMRPDLLQSLQVLTQLALHAVGQHL
jgi:hypothetical protein